MSDERPTGFKLVDAYARRAFDAEELCMKRLHEISELNQQLRDLRKILAFIPAATVIKAREEAGLGVTVHLAGGIK